MQVSRKSNAQVSASNQSIALIAVMGATGTGKTTLINMASGSSLRVGQGLKSCTDDVQATQRFSLDGRPVMLIDTPGFDDTTKSDTDILTLIAGFLAATYQGGQKLAGVIYIHRISDFRMGGISTRNFKMFRQLCGESTLKNVVILTNMWGEVDKKVGEAREHELATQDMFFKPVLDKGGRLMRHDNTRESANNILRQIFKNHPLTLQIQTELIDQKKDISETAAGEELNRELAKQLKKHQEEMRSLQEEMKEAIRAKDEEYKQELEVESKKLQAEMTRVQGDAHKLASEYDQEKRRMEERMQKMAEAARKETEKAAAEYRRQMGELTQRLEKASAASIAERQELLRQIEELRNRRRGGGGSNLTLIEYEDTEIQSSSWTSSTFASAKTFVVDESDVAIAVMGATGSGKTTFINSASGSDLRVGHSLQSCTSVVQVAQAFELDGRSVTLIDTPGFDDTTRSDAEILRMIATFLATAYENGKKLAGVIYIHRISDFRMGGISTRNFKMFRQLCGESTLKNVIILTNMWGEVSRDVGEAREFELSTQDMFFKPVLDRGAQLLRYDNTQETAHNVLRYIIDNHPLTLQIQRELVDQKKDISQTAAGEELNRELMAQIQKHQVIIDKFAEAIRTKDEETRRELEVETRKLQAEMNRVQNDAQRLVSEYSEEKRRMEERMAQLSEAARQEQERVNAEYNRQMTALRAQLEHSSSASMAERREFNRQIEDLRRSRGRNRGGFFAMIGRAIDNVFGI
ncbi:hypothetical protein CVT26_014935 [Gymnopilus dilepis]|uniref:G domain-containing protein n=1 Tax=Gymnopilus dilepis TaxID=231916 RepID=A0A409XWU9_9AGAR|nr:hypothetical protein CVT26_014935 [Gymnopilus dilepis]